MLGGSSSDTASLTTANSSSMDTLPPKKVYTCHTCDLVFEDSQAQRTHMREPWHVYNLKRRMSSLPPISADNYAENIATSLVSSKQKSSGPASSSAVAQSLPEEEPAEQSEEPEDLGDDQAQTNSCLFCTKVSDGLETNLAHMSSEHSLYIPEIEHVSSLETIVDYLRTVIIKYNECLYCGMTKHSVEGIRQHMLDKGHCMINLEREPELLEFWEFSDSDGDDTEDGEAAKSQDRKSETAASGDMSHGEYTLPSGRVVGSKNKAREARLLARRTASASKENSNRMVDEGPIDNIDDASSANPIESLIRSQRGTQDRTVAVRDAMGLIGVSDQQRRGLITVQRKMQRQQALVRASASWADELGGVSQKHYKQKMNLRDG